MADSVHINTRAGVGSSVNSSVGSSGAVRSSVSSGISTTSSVIEQNTFQTTTTGASGPQGEPGADGVFSEIASQAEAEAGSDNTKGMSPLRVKQAIDAIATGDVASVNGQTGTVSLDQDDIGDGTTYKQYSATEKIKLSGIATGATANSSDATLLNRSNHTGSQAISTITGLQTALDGKEPAKGADDNYVTDAEKVVIGNTSGTNTGDQDLSNYATGPASATDNAVPRYNGTTGKILQDSGWTIDDTDTLLGAGTLNSTTIAAAPYMAANTLEEYNTDTGVTVEAVLIKDGLVDGRDVASDGNKLDGIESGAEANTVDSVNGDTGAVTISETDILPTQTGNSGKYLTTDGTNSSWATLGGGGDMSASTYDPAGIAQQVLGTSATQTVTNKDLTSGTNTFPTFNQNTTGSAATLTTSRTFRTNLASTSTASFNGSANVTPGVTGTLAVGNGGTGATTASGARTSLGVDYTTIIGQVYPVGTIYMNSSNSTNPGTLFGVGTWVAIEDRVIAGAGSTITAGATGGTSSVTLTTNELPAHSHSITDPGHTHTMTQQVIYRNGVGTGSQNTETTGNRSIGQTAIQSNTTGISVDSAGSGNSFSIWNPYYGAYVWRRTA